jgi:hypothetical protein
MNTLQQLSALAGEQNYAGIRKLQGELFVQRMKMDKFFSLFLDKFERKMDPDNTDTPIWKLYKAKLKEYGELERAIKSSNYYMTRNLTNV